MVCKEQGWLDHRSPRNTILHKSRATKRQRRSFSPPADCIFLGKHILNTLEVCETAKSTRILFEDFRAVLVGDDDGEVGGKDPSDQPTPSMLEEDDGANSVDDLDEFMGSLTNDETDRMFQGFESYMEDNHNCDGNLDKGVKKQELSKTPKGFATKTSSLRKWMKCNSASHSVEGIYVNNGFEPSIHTLDGLRTNLFGLDLH